MAGLTWLAIMLLAGKVGGAIDLEGQSCDSVWTDCRGCSSTGGYCGTPSGAQGEQGGYAAKVVCGLDNCNKPIPYRCEPTGRLFNSGSPTLTLYTEGEWSPGDCRQACSENRVDRLFEVEEGGPYDPSGFVCNAYSWYREDWARDGQAGRGRCRLVHFSQAQLDVYRPRQNFEGATSCFCPVEAGCGAQPFDCTPPGPYEPETDYPVFEGSSDNYFNYCNAMITAECGAPCHSVLYTEACRDECVRHGHLPAPPSVEGGGESSDEDPCLEPLYAVDKYSTCCANGGYATEGHGPICELAALCKKRGFGHQDCTLEQPDGCVDDHDGFEQFMKEHFSDSVDRVAKFGCEGKWANWCGHATLGDGVREHCPVMCGVCQPLDEVGAIDLEGQSCDSVWTDCRGCSSTGGYCGTPSGAQGEQGGHAAKVVCGLDNCNKPSPVPPQELKSWSVTQPVVFDQLEATSYHDHIKIAYELGLGQVVGIVTIENGKTLLKPNCSIHSSIQASRRSARVVFTVEETIEDGSNLEDKLTHWMLHGITAEELAESINEVVRTESFLSDVAPPCGTARCDTVIHVQEMRASPNHGADMSEAALEYGHRHTEETELDPWLMLGIGASVMVLVGVVLTTLYIYCRRQTTNTLPTSSPEGHTAVSQLEEAPDVKHSDMDHAPPTGLHPPSPRTLELQPPPPMTNQLECTHTCKPPRCQCYAVCSSRLHPTHTTRGSHPGRLWPLGRNYARRRRRPEPRDQSTRADSNLRRIRVRWISPVRLGPRLA